LRVTALSETSPVASFNHPDKGAQAGLYRTPIEGGYGVRARRRRGPDRARAGETARSYAIRGPTRDEWATGTSRGPRPKAITDGCSRPPATCPGGFRRLLLHRRPWKKEPDLRGGYNVYPRGDRGSAARSTLAVAEVAVIGIRTRIWGGGGRRRRGAEAGRQRKRPRKLSCLRPGPGRGVQVSAARLAGGPPGLRGPTGEDPAA